MRPEIEKAVELLQTRDDAGVEQALALLQNTVFSFSMRVCGHREDAEDTMQEVLLKSLPQLSKFSSPKALVVWLYKVAKNRCLMNRRRSKFAPAKELSLDELMPDRNELEQLSTEGRINPESFAIRGEQASRLRDAIQKLPPHYRIVLVLSDMEGLSDDEVGEITGVRPGTVRVRLHRARLFVRKELMRTLLPRRATKQTVKLQRIIVCARAAARRCSPNCRTTLTSSWTIPSAKSWNAISMVAARARHFWQLSRRASSNVADPLQTARTAADPPNSAKR